MGKHNYFKVARNWYCRKKTKGGHWSLWVRDPAGDVYYDLSTSDRSEAMRQATRLHGRYRYDVQGLRGHEPEQTTFEQAETIYRRERTDLRPYTVYDNLNCVRQAFAYIKAVRLSDATPALLRAYLTRADLAPATRYGYYVRLRAFFRWCLRRGLLQNDPMADLKKPKRAKALPEFLTREDLRRVEAALQADLAQKVAEGKAAPNDLLWLIDVMWFAVLTGLRRAELVNLRWLDVRRDEGLIYVRPYEDRKRGVVHRIKSRDERAVVIVDRAAEILDRLHAARTSEDDTETVFTGEAGRRLSGDLLTKRFKRYVRKAGLPEAITWHSLRKTFCSWLVQNGMTLAEVRAQAGHADFSTTLLYAHLRPEDSREKMNRILT